MLKYILILLTLYTTTVVAQKQEEYNSVCIDSIHVTATRVKFEENFNTINRISLDSLNYTASLQVSDLINKLPGVYIKDYGGIGGIKTVSLRGCGSNQTNVAINGFTINSSANGSFDFSNLPSNLLSSVNIMKGGFSAQQGSGAIGGSIDLILDAPNEKSYSTQVNYGNFNTYQIAGSIVDSIYNTKNSLALNYQHSDGDYSISNNQFGETSEYNRKNSEFDNYSISYGNFYTGDKIKISTSILAYHSNRGVPGPILQGNLENQSANLIDNKVMAIINTGFFANDNNSFDISAMLQMGKSSYSDSTNLKFGLPFQLDYDDYSLNFKAEYSNITEKFINIISLQTKYDNLKGTMLQTAKLNNISRLLNSLLLSSTFIVPVKKIDMNVNAGLRFEFADEPNFFLSPAISTALKYDKWFSNISLSYSYNYRMPSFNEMYYLNYGNTDLKPEFSHSLNLNYRFDYFDFMNLDLSGFIINTQDKIVSVPKSPVAWSADNLGQALNRGMEVELSGDIIDDLLNYSCAYTYQKVTDETQQSPSYQKQLIYTPEGIFSASIDFTPKVLRFGVNGQYVSHRYSMSDNSFYSFMPAYFLLNSYIGKKVETRFCDIYLSFNCDNILGEEYQVVVNYPMPRQQFYFSVKVSNK